MPPSQYDPKKHHRRSIRLKGYDYSQPGAYFILYRAKALGAQVTICTRGKQCLLGKIENGEMELNELGDIVWEIWLSLPQRYPQIQLGPAIVMPNHFHAIIEIPSSVGAIQESPKRQSNRDLNDQKTRRKMTIPLVMGYFKMNAAKKINLILGTSGTPFWQRDYYEHISRNEPEYEQTALYILSNPQNWQDDEEYWEG